MTIMTLNTHDYSSFKFLLRNRNMSMFLGLIQLHFADTSSPALEKRCSEGTEVPGIDKYFSANILSSV